MIKPRRKRADRKTCGGSRLSAGRPTFAGAMLTVGIQVGLGSGSVAFEPNPFSTGRVADSPHAAMLSTRNAALILNRSIVTSFPPERLKHNAAFI